MRLSKGQYAKLLSAGFTERQINTMQEKFYTLMNAVALPEPVHLQEIESLRQQLAELESSEGLAHSMLANRIVECDQLRQQLAASQQSLLSVYEVWAGSDGMPMPEDELGWYLFQLIEKMRDAAKGAIK